MIFTIRHGCRRSNHGRPETGPTCPNVYSLAFQEGRRTTQWRPRRSNIASRALQEEPRRVKINEKHIVFCMIFTIRHGSSKSSPALENVSFWPSDTSLFGPASAKRPNRSARELPGSSPGAPREVGVRWSWSLLFPARRPSDGPTKSQTGPTYPNVCFAYFPMRFTIITR